MKYYYGYETRNPEDGPFYAKVFHYDHTGNVEIVDYKGKIAHSSKYAAEDEAAEWCDENGIDAEMS